MRELVRRGHPVTPPLAAALGTLRAPPEEDVQMALAVAVSDDQVESARLALEAGADPNASPRARRQRPAAPGGALTDDVELLELLVAHGARCDIEDGVWGATPLGWAIHENRPAARAFLENRPAARAFLENL